MAGISSKAAGKLDNRYRFNDATERTSDFDLGWDETECRVYDAQIGRFLQVDPFSEISDQLSTYNYANNNPVLRNDPYGLKDTTVNGESANTADPLETIVIVGKRPNKESETGSESTQQAFVVTPAPVSPVNPGPGTIGPSRPFTPMSPGSGIGAARAIGFSSTFLLAMRPYEAGRGSTLPDPAFWRDYWKMHDAFRGHANRRNNSNAHIVCQISFTPVPGDKRTPILKYGISDWYRYGLDRPDKQLPRLFALYGASVKITILTRVVNREQALAFEQDLVNRHYTKWGEMPRDQIYPKPQF